MHRWIPGLVVASLAWTGVSSTLGQSVPWDVYFDSVSDAACDIVNTGNFEVVVFSDTGELIVVTGEDYALGEAAFVDDDGVFFFAGLPLGQVSFAEDGDGFPRAWLLAPDDTVLELDPDTGEPIFTSLIPSDFVDVPCDAFDLWDDDDFDDVPDEFDFCPDTPIGEFVDEDGCDCAEFDSDEDGVDDCADECPLTPFDEGADDFGCSCSEYDDDGDGVDDCVDECPLTPLDEIADDFGCSCIELDGDADGIEDCFDDCPNSRLGADVDIDGCEGVVIVPPPVIVACGNFTALTMMLTLAGLASLRMTRHRFSRRSTLESE